MPIDNLWTNPKPKNWAPIYQGSNEKDVSSLVIYNMTHSAYYIRKSDAAHFHLIEGDNVKFTYSRRGITKPKKASLKQSRFADMRDYFVLDIRERNVI